MGCEEFKSYEEQTKNPEISNNSPLTAREIPIEVKNFKQQVEETNNEIYEFISKYPNLLSHIKKELKKDSSKNQQFLLLGYIAGETAKYVRENDPVSYEEGLKDLLNGYISTVNEAKQKLSEIEFFEMFKNLTDKIKTSVENTPNNAENLQKEKERERRGLFGRLFRKSY